MKVSAATDMTDSQANDVDKIFEANGMASRNDFWRECLRSLRNQTRGGMLIVWPPEFVMQWRTKKQFVTDRWESVVS